MKLSIAGIAIILAACSNSDASRRALEQQGFTDIETTGWSPMSCSDDDTFSTGFKATNAQGQRVSGTVCCGWLKNCTVRW